MEWIQSFLNILYPRVCGSCANTLRLSEKHICISCLIHLPRTYSHIEITPALEHKFAGKLQVKNTYSFLKFSKKGKVQELLHNLKYRNKPDLAKYLGEIYGTELKENKVLEDIDLVLGIPLHKRRETERGYNQADEFAKGLAKSLGTVISTDAISRVSETSTQTNKSRFQRFLNMEEVFIVNKHELIVGKNILLVDDVLTTGSTLSSCGAVLLEAGCKQISICTIASAY